MKIKNIMRKPLVVASILAALTVGIASAKSYRFAIPAAAMAGSHELKADQSYKVEVNGSQAVITGEKDGKAMNVAVKAEQSATKYSATSVESTQAASPAGPRIIKAIQLGGSNTRLVLAE